MGSGSKILANLKVNAYVLGYGGGGLSIMDLIYWLVLNVGSLALLIAGTEFVVEQAIFLSWLT